MTEAYVQNMSSTYSSKERPDDFGGQLAIRHSTLARPQSPTLPVLVPLGSSLAPPQQPSSKSDQGTCYLLSLPKELRLEIWKYVLTDPSVSHLTAQITRQPLSPSKSSLRFPHPHIHVTLNPSRNAHININLLRVNHLIYQESLPILFNSVRFAPLDLEGIFPLFLDTLPSYNRSLIRHAKLRIPPSIYDIDLFGDPSSCLFHWAVTCAQVAKVENLRDVMIEGFETHESTRVSQGLLNPLAKMKAQKIFCGENSQRAHQGLMEAEVRLAVQTRVRNRLQCSEEKQVHQERARLYWDGQETIDDVEVQSHAGNSTIPPVLRIDTSSSPATHLVPSSPRIMSPERPHPPLYEDDPPPYAADWDIVSVGSSVISPSSSSLSPELEPTTPISFSLSEDDDWTDTVSVSPSSAAAPPTAIPSGHVTAAEAGHASFWTFRGRLVKQSD